MEFDSSLLIINTTAPQSLRMMKYSGEEKTSISSIQMCWNLYLSSYSSLLTREQIQEHRSINFYSSDQSSLKTWESRKKSSRREILPFEKRILRRRDQRDEDLMILMTMMNKKKSMNQLFRKTKTVKILNMVPMDSTMLFICSLYLEMLQTLLHSTSWWNNQALTLMPKITKDSLLSSRFSKTRWSISQRY